MSIKYKNSDILTVQNVAALFSLKNLLDNQLVQTQGYTSEGVGANLYRYDAASSATIDGGFVLPGPGGTLSFSATTFNGNAGTGGRFIAVDQTVADVTKFGAISDGDGGTENSNAFNRSLSVVQTYSCSVYIPPGEYYVNERLYMPDASYVIDGHGATIYLGSVLDSYHFLQNLNSTTPITSFECRGLTVVDTANSSAAWKAIVSIEKCGRTVIDRCRFIDVSTTCIQIGSRAVSMVGGSQGDVSITGCNAYNESAYVSGNFAKIEAATSLFFIGNEIKDYSRGFSLELTNAAIGCDSVVCSNNVFSSCSVSNKSSTQTAIPIHINCQFASNYITTLTISNNQVRALDLTGTASQGFGMMISCSTDGQIQSFSCTNNLFDGITLGHITNFSYVCYLNNVGNGVFGGNVFTNVSYTQFTFTANSGTDFVTATGHSYTDTTPVVLSTTGTLPAPLATGTVYYVRDRTGDTFKLAATSGGAAIDITDAGTGTHSVNSIYRGIVVSSSVNLVVQANILVGDFDIGMYINGTTYSTVIANTFTGTFSSGREILAASATGTIFANNYAAGVEVN